MGASCGAVNNKHATSKIKDKHSEFRNKFYKIWNENPIYKFRQEDIDLIDKSQTELVLKGPAFFVLHDFINNLPKVDDFNKRVFNHLNKLYYEKLNSVLQGLFPDVGQFFLNIVIFLLSNPNMSSKKHNLAESFINCYLVRPRKKKSKKAKKGEDEEKKGEDVEKKDEEKKVDDVKVVEQNGVDPNVVVPPEPVKSTTSQSLPKVGEVPAKKLNLAVMKEICQFLVKFSRQVLIYFVLNFIFILDSSKTNDMFDFDAEVKGTNENVIYDFEQTFLSNFKLVNRQFNTETFDTMWVTYLLSPFDKRIFIIKI